jgi:hypothetical protein
MNWTRSRLHKRDLVFVNNISSIVLHLIYILLYMPVPVAARSKGQVYGRSPAAIIGSNPTGAMDVCVLCVLCVVW